MLKIREYVKAESLQEAYELNQKKGNIVLGGMLWQRLQKRSVGTAIDLSGLGLDAIEETEEGFRIGAMVTLRQIELHSGLNRYTQNMVREAVKNIVGVQFRNMATVGGSVWGRFGFSDVITMLLVMDSDVELFQGGIIPLETFVCEGAERDILVAIRIPKRDMAMSYQSQRNAKTDFPVLNCAVSREGEAYLCAVGARPGRAVCFTDEEGILRQGITQKGAEAFGIYVQERIVTGSNMRAGADYRKTLAGVLVKRALLGLEVENTCR